MAWEDVPVKLAKYTIVQYGGIDAVNRLLSEFVPHPYPLLAENVPVARREDFEKALDYRYGAAYNLSKSVAWKPKTMQV